jgi:hypothetical protein
MQKEASKSGSQVWWHMQVIPEEYQKDRKERGEREREKEKKKEEEEEEEDREIKRKEKNGIARAKPGVVAHTYNPSTREAESGGS